MANNLPAVPGGRGKLIALVGAASATLLTSYVPKFEGTVLRGYKDPIGIVTACTGNTKSAVLGRAYTPAECATLLDDDLATHAAGVLKCSPKLAAPDLWAPRAAVISFAFNVGTGAYCGSTMARKINAGDIAGACAEFPKWTMAGGRQLPGLVTRRNVERAMCEGKLT